METDTDENIGAGANIQSNEDVQTAYLPLMDAEGKLLPVHFLTAAQVINLARSHKDLARTRPACFLGRQFPGNLLFE